MTDSHEMKDVQRGSIIKTINGANKQETWSLVLGCMEDRDSVTCLRLTSGEEFKNISSLKITSDIFGEDVAVYANPFSFLNIKIEWIKEVLDPISPIEYYAVISSIVNYFAGFFYKDEEGQLKMDMPYVQNPVFFMISGMVTINQARNIELSTKIRMQERIEKKEKDEVDRKLNAVKPFSKKRVGQKTPQPKDVKKAFESLGVYTLDTQNRIEAIYKFFQNYLAPGERLSIPMVYRIMFKGALLQKMQSSSSSVNRDEFAFIISNDVVSIANRLSISSITARSLRIQALCIFNGSEQERAKVASPNSEMYERAKELYNQGSKSTEVRDILMKEYNLGKIDAKRIAINAIPSKGNTRKENDRVNRILDIISCKWASSLIDAGQLLNDITVYSEKADKIYNGTITVDTGDNFNDAIILMAIYGSINSWKWFQFIFEDQYHRIAETFSKMTINDILKRYKTPAMSHQTFYSSKVMILKIMSSIMCLSNDDKLYLKAVATGAVKCDPEKIDPICKAFVHSTANAISKSMSKAVGQMIGIPNADTLFSNIDDGTLFTCVPDSDLIPTYLSNRLQ